MKTVEFMTENHGKQVMYFIGYNRAEENAALQIFNSVYGNSVVKENLSDQVLDLFQKEIGARVELRKIHYFRPSNLK
jgi:hypothetical protein